MACGRPGTINYGYIYSGMCQQLDNVKRYLASISDDNVGDDDSRDFSLQHCQWPRQIVLATILENLTTIHRASQETILRLEEMIVKGQASKILNLKICLSLVCQLVTNYETCFQIFSEYLANV